MKPKPSLFFAVILCICALNAKSQSPDSTKKYLNLMVKVDLLTNGFSALMYKEKGKPKYFSGTIEKCFKKNHSVQFSFYNCPVENLFQKRWFVTALEYKYFVSKRSAYCGYYVGGGFKYINYSRKSTGMDWVPPQTLNDPSIPKNEGELRTHSTGLGFINGIQFIIWKRMVIDLLGGIGLYGELGRKYTGFYSTFNTNASKDYYDFTINKHVDYRFGLNLGFRF